MYDPITVAMIGNARALVGLNPSDLAQELTSAHIEIAAVRLALGDPTPESMDDLANALRRLARLADIYEAEIVLNLNLTHTKSMAFVAASARQANSQAGRILGGSFSRCALDEYSIGPDVTAALLYLIAERSSDAFEAARFIVIGESGKKFSDAVAVAIRNYVQGHLQQIITDSSDSDAWDDADLDPDPAELLFRELLKGMIVLAQVGLGSLDVAEIESAKRFFGAAHELSIESSTMKEHPNIGIVFNSIFSGPRHLAALLLSVASGLGLSAVVLVPAPVGSDTQAWRKWLKSEAATWPFLWENHREAISLGFLDTGNSLVMTTPTGSGKTTLASLKIAATLSAGKTVLYLAPTHALVSQVERDLNERVGNIETAQSIEDISLDENIEKLPAISVVTPERCFALLTFAPEIFENVGLLVFDECHLLGASNKSAAVIKADRRSVDAMLCLLTFINVNPGADCLLLSAMINNGTDVAAWLQNLLGRPVYAYDNKWKPTRQLRSSVVYKYQDIRLLERGLQRKATKGESPPSAIPYGIFSLSAGWNPGSVEKLVIKSFSPDAVPLKIGISKRSSRYLTANRNVVAAAIALRLAAKGMKVIIFCDSVSTCSSIADKINKSMGRLHAKFTVEQAKWRADILQEIGSAAGVYDSGEFCAAVHHGELLPNERKLVESLFKDKDSGVNVLAATSTLSQGLNLPCEAVIIAGTDRLDDSDPEEKKRTPLLAHEILNAIGRAGRAGQAATGLSIIVPGKPITCDFDTMDVSDEHDLSIIFAADDQCFPLTDPLTTLFDQIETSGAKGPEAQYLLRRLAVSLRAAHETFDSFEYVARRTFGFYQKVRIDQSASEKWLLDRKRTLEGALTSVGVSNVEWIEELAAKTGASSSFITALVDNYSTAPRSSSQAEVWLTWLLNLLSHEDDSFDIFLRPETMARVFGRAITSIEDSAAQRMLARESIRHIVGLWFSGKTLIELEKEIAAWIAALEGAVARPTSPHKKVKRARRFVLRVIPDIAFLSGILVQVGQKIATEKGEAVPRMLRFIPSLIRKGIPTAYHYALNGNAETGARTNLAAEFMKISEYVDMNAYDDWETISDKVRTARGLAGFRDSAN
jgi:superfamily II DNA or RNA helicase